MFQRRSALNRPVLRCRVDLPPAPILPCQVTGSALSTPALGANSTISTGIPITPIAQIMPHTPQTPPVCTLQSTRQPKQKLRLGLDAVKLEPSPENDYTDLSSNLAFTPLETPTLGGLGHKGAGLVLATALVRE